MLLRYLKIKNFVSHENVEIAFPEEGTFLLAGPSGIGKSSLIVDAVAYALYGAAATRGKKQASLRNSDNPDAEMSVETIWDLNGERLIVARGMDSKNASWAKVYQPKEKGEEDLLLAESAKPVARFVSERLGGMTWQQFYSAFVARQSEITLMTSLKGTQRKDLIHRMLGMRELEKAEQLITNKLRRTRATGDQLARSIGGIDLAKEKEKITNLETRKEEIQAELNSGEQVQVETNQKIKKLKAKLEEQKEQRQNFLLFEKNNSELQILETKQPVLKEKVEKHEAAVSRSGVSSEDLEVEIKNKENCREKLRDLFFKAKELDEAKEELSLVVKDYQDFQETLPEEFSQEDSFESLQKDLALLEQEKTTIEKELPVFKKRIEKLKDSGECFVCQREFASAHDHQKVLADLRENLNEKENRIKTIKRKQEEITTLLPLFKENKEWQNQVEALTVKINDFPTEEINQYKDLEEIKAKGKEISESLKEKTQQLAAFEAVQKDLNPGAVAELEELEKEIKKIRQELDQGSDLDPNAEKEYEATLDEINQLELSLAGLEGNKSQLKKQLVQIDLDQKKQKQFLQGHEHEIKEMKKNAEAIQTCETTTALIRGYQQNLAKEIRPAIEEIASEMINRISNGKHVGLKISDNYEISIETSSGVIIPTEMISGGEGVRANICLRLALTRLVSQRTGMPVGFLVLDEPLPSQDTGHIEKMMELLESLKPFYRQQFIISHVGDLRSNDVIDYILDFDVSDSGKTTVQLVNA